MSVKREMIDKFLSDKLNREVHPGLYDVFVEVIEKWENFRITYGMEDDSDTY